MPEVHGKFKVHIFRFLGTTKYSYLKVAFNFTWNDKNDKFRECKLKWVSPCVLTFKLL